MKGKWMLLGLLLPPILIAALGTVYFFNSYSTFLERRNPEKAAELLKGFETTESMEGLKASCLAITARAFGFAEDSFRLHRNMLYACLLMSLWLAGSAVVIIRTQTVRP